MAKKSIYWEQEEYDEIVYKYPSNEVTLGSVLTVHESQEAFFFKNGVLYDSFLAGRHELSSANLPLLQRLVNLSSGQTTFIAEIWFVDKLMKRNMYWGTGGLRIIDPYFQIPIKLSARGQYGIQISDGSVFLKKTVGKSGYIDLSLIEDQFRIDVIEAVKISLSKYMKEQNLNINEIGSEYKNLAQIIAKTVQINFNEFGITVLNFNIEDISFDENDKGYLTVMEGIAEQAKLERLGVNYLQQKQIDIAQSAAQNEGAGNFMGIGIGLGMGNILNNTINTLNQPQTQIQSPAPPPPQLPSYFVAINEQTLGPYSINIIQEMIMRKEIIATTFVCKVGGQEWCLASTDSQIAHLLNILTPNT